MKKVRVHFTTGAGAMAEVEVPDDWDPKTGVEIAIDAAWQVLDTGLCHHCAGHVELGDFDAVEITSTNGDPLWTDGSIAGSTTPIPVAGQADTPPF